MAKFTPYLYPPFHDRIYTHLCPIPYNHGKMYPYLYPHSMAEFTPYLPRLYNVPSVSRSTASCWKISIWAEWVMGDEAWALLCSCAMACIPTYSTSVLITGTLYLVPAAAAAACTMGWGG